MTNYNNGNGNGHNGNGHNGRNNLRNLTPLQVAEQQERFLANIEAEEDTLAALMQSPFAIQRVVDGLEPDDFYRDTHRTLYTVMKYLYEHDRRVNLINVRDELQRRCKLEEVEQMTSLNSLQYSVRPLQRGPIEDAVHEVKKKAIHRRLREAGQEIFNLGNSEDENAVEQALELINRVAMGSAVDAIEPFQDVVDSTMIALRQRRIDAENMIARGLPTGYPELDRMFGGLQPGHLITVCALTGYGKSSFALNAALNIALSPSGQGRKRVYFASLEMSRDEIVERALSVRAEVDHSLIRDGALSDEAMEKVEEAAEALSECEIYLDDSSYTVKAIQRQVKRLHAQQPLDLIVVDYLQLIEVATDKKNSNQAQELEEISRQLKQLAQELRVPIMALVQINRAVEEGKEPTLKDIHGSGGIARNSNVTIMIYALADQLEDRNEARPFQMTFKVVKARSGRLGAINLVYAPCITKFLELSNENLARYDDSQEQEDDDAED